MGAMKRFYEDCAAAGRCPLSVETLDYLDDIECEHQLDWIGYCEHDYRSAVTGLLVSHDCITLESARRLMAEGLANDEIVGFVECFGDLSPAVVPAVMPSHQESAGVCQARCQHEWEHSPLAGYDYWCQRCLLPGMRTA